MQQPKKKEKQPKPTGGSKEAEKLVRRLEREIDAQETRVAALNEALLAAGTDYEEYMSLTEQLGTEERLLEGLMAQWEAAMSELE